MTRLIALVSLLAACSTSAPEATPDAPPSATEVRGTLAELAARVTPLPTVTCLANVDRASIGVSIGVHGATPENAPDSHGTWIFPAVQTEPTLAGTGEIAFDLVAYNAAIASGKTPAQADAATPARFVPCLSTVRPE